jgi:hypothetical protein
VVSIRKYNGNMKSVIRDLEMLGLDRLARRQAILKMNRREEASSGLFYLSLFLGAGFTAASVAGSDFFRGTSELGCCGGFLIMGLGTYCSIELNKYFEGAKYRLSKMALLKKQANMEGGRVGNRDYSELGIEKFVDRLL